MSGAAAREIRVLPGLPEVTRAAAEEVVAALSGLPAPPSMLLSGGSTPRALYRLLADPAAPYAARVPWEKVRIFWGDERHVPPDHPDSNYRMVREAMLDHLPVAAAHVHRIRGEEPDARRAAERYERELIESFHLLPDREGAARPEDLDWPRFSVALLGLGEEGHTASWFPGSPVLDERRHLVAAPWVAAHQSYRITATPPVLNHAARVIFLVSGSSKARALAGVLRGLSDLGELDGLGGEARPSLYPAQVVAPDNGRLLWLVDRDAAAMLA